MVQLLTFSFIGCFLSRALLLTAAIANSAMQR